jgi:hypothetical protein
VSFLFPSSTITFEAAIRDLASRNAKSRAAAAHALGDVVDPTEKRRAVEALIAALEDDRPEVRAEACSSLGELGEAAAVPGLIKRLDDGSEPVRQNAAIALGSLRALAIDGFEPLALALREGPADLRFQAATSIAEIDAAAFGHAAPRDGSAGRQRPTALSIAGGDARACPRTPAEAPHADAARGSTSPTHRRAQGRAARARQRARRSGTRWDASPRSRLKDRDALIRALTRAIPPEVTPPPPRAAARGASARGVSPPTRAGPSSGSLSAAHRVGATGRVPLEAGEAPRTGCSK